MRKDLTPRPPSLKGKGEKEKDWGFLPHLKVRQKSRSVGWAALWVGAVILLVGCAGRPDTPAAAVSPLPGVTRPAVSPSIAPSATALSPTATPAAAETTPGAATASPSATPNIEVQSVTPDAAEATPAAATAAPSATPTIEVRSATPDARLSPERWQEWPVIPALSAHARQVLSDGLARGANPHAFAKVGDCETLTDWFLVDFDRGSRYYNLGPYTSLQAVIDTFAGSFQRMSIASARGFTAASALSPIWADPKVCQTGETPLACEYRVQKPILSFIMLGTNDVSHKLTFEANLRKIIEQSLAQGVLPVLTTKADNLEGDQQLNRTIAALAYEYDIPLWNYWLAVQPLPNHGLQADGAHLTHAPNHFEAADALESAWPVRNLTALQVLEVVRQALPVKFPGPQD